jgi:ABC-type multidrug transport system fused ATPase/permease subunit
VSAWTPPWRRLADAWRRVAPLTGGRPRPLVILSVRAVIGGFLEAGMLVVLVQVAFAISKGGDEIEVGLGPLGDLTLSVSELLVIGVGLGLARLVVQMADARLSARMSTDAITHLRTELVWAFEAADWPRQAQEREGHLQEVIGGHTAQVASAVGTIAGSLSTGFNLAALLASAIVVDAVAALAIVVGVGALFFLLRPLARRSRQTSATYARLNLSLAQGTHDLVRLSQEIKVHHVEDDRTEALGAVIEAGGDAYFNNQFLARAVPAIYQAAAMILVITTLAVINAADIVEVQSLGAIVLMLFRALAYGQGLQSSYQRLGDLLPFADRVTRTIADLEAHPTPKGTVPLREIGSVAFTDVSFSYGTGRDALHHVTFSVDRGQCLGVVGPSGAGKSTLIQLLLGLRGPTSGSVQVDGHDQSDLDPADWFARVGFVPQDPQLVEGTVAENIRFFRPEASDDEVVRAARLAHLHDEIEGLPEQYDTAIGPRHQTVSGGQRQRLCLARALLGHPDLLILDEPTSALDLRSEHLVHQTLDELSEDLVVVVVAHRLSTLNICDRIMVLEEGRVRGLLPAAELVEQNDFFREVVALAHLR